MPISAKLGSMTEDPRDRSNHYNHSLSLSADSARQARHLGHVHGTQVKMSSTHGQLVIMSGQARDVRETPHLQPMQWLPTANQGADGAATVQQLSSELHHHASNSANQLAVHCTSARCASALIASISRALSHIIAKSTTILRRAPFQRLPISLARSAKLLYSASSLVNQRCRIAAIAAGFLSKRPTLLSTTNGTLPSSCMQNPPLSKPCCLA